MIKVSVIVPVYNMEEYLERCLDSLLEQTLDDIEIIAVDDGSTDSSAEILRRYSEKSAKIISVRKENGGSSDARNFGLSYASGEYIGYLDSDDFVDPVMYNVMYCKAAENASDIVECNLHHTFTTREDTERVKKYYTKKELLCFGRNIVWNKIFRRTWLLETGVRFPFGLIYEDVSFCINLVPYITRYDYVDIAPVHYFQRSGSVNNSSSVKTLQIIGVLREILDFYTDRGYYSEYEQELEYLYARILLCSSFKRMCNIPGRLQRKDALTRNFRELIDTFPLWRHNKVLKSERSRYGLYMRSVNKITYRMYSLLLPAFFSATGRFSRKRYS